PSRLADTVPLGTSRTVAAAGSTIGFMASMGKAAMTRSAPAQIPAGSSWMERMPAARLSAATPSRTTASAPGIMPKRSPLPARPAPAQPRDTVRNQAAAAEQRDRGWPIRQPAAHQREQPQEEVTGRRHPGDGRLEGHGGLRSAGNPGKRADPHRDWQEDEEEGRQAEGVRRHSGKRAGADGLDGAGGSEQQPGVRDLDAETKPTPTSRRLVQRSTPGQRQQLQTDEQ